jgi:hypothetical protein
MIQYHVTTGITIPSHGKLLHAADQADTLVIALIRCCSTAHQPTGSTLSGTVATGHRDAVCRMGRHGNILPDRGQDMELSLLRDWDSRRSSCA